MTGHTVYCRDSLGSRVKLILEFFPDKPLADLVRAQNGFCAGCRKDLSAPKKFKVILLKTFISGTAVYLLQICHLPTKTIGTTVCVSQEALILSYTVPMKRDPHLASASLLNYAGSSGQFYTLSSSHIVSAPAGCCQVLV